MRFLVSCILTISICGVAIANDGLSGDWARYKKSWGDITDYQYLHLDDAGGGFLMVSGLAGDDYYYSIPPGSAVEREGYREIAFRHCGSVMKILASESKGAKGESNGPLFGVVYLFNALNGELSLFNTYFLKLGVIRRGDEGWDHFRELAVNEKDGPCE